MDKAVKTKYHKLVKAENKQKLLEKHFFDFLTEAVFRSTKIEHPKVTRNQVKKYLK